MEAAPSACCILRRVSARRRAVNSGATGAPPVRQYGGRAVTPGSPPKIEEYLNQPVSLPDALHRQFELDFAGTGYYSFSIGDLRKVAEAKKLCHPTRTVVINIPAANMEKIRF